MPSRSRSLNVERWPKVWNRTNQRIFSLCVLCEPVSVYRYDPQTDVWTAVAPMSISRDAVGVCLLGDRLYAVGGYDGQVYLSTVEAYDPQTNEWTQVHT